MYDLDGDDVEGDVMGFDVVGDVMGDDEVVGVVKVNPRTGRKSIVRVPAGGGRTNAIRVKKPSWRQDQVAPGVQRPDEGMVPLPLVGQAGATPGLFAVGLSQITFQGQLQKPYRAERLLTSTVRNTATAVGRLLGVLYVGTDLQQAEIAGWDIELIGQPGSFGTRLTCQAAEPGVMIRLVVTCQPALSVAGDTIQANVMFLGRIIH
jgi:hypothetical protein